MLIAIIIICQENKTETNELFVKCLSVVTCLQRDVGNTVNEKNFKFSICGKNYRFDTRDKLYD